LAIAREDDIMVFDAVDDAPRVAEAARNIESTGQCINVHIRVAPAAGLTDGGPYSVAQLVAPGRVETKAIGTRADCSRPVLCPILCSLDCLRFDEAYGRGEVLTEQAATIVVNDGYLVIANAIDVIFLETLRGIVDQELANTGIPVGKDPTTNPLMVGAVKTA